MLSLSSPAAGALSAARSFFTPPTVTPVDGPAAWFAAQRGSRPAGAPVPPTSDPDALAEAIEAFELGGDTVLDAPEPDVRGARRDDGTSR